MTDTVIDHGQANAVSLADHGKARAADSTRAYSLVTGTPADQRRGAVGHGAE